MWDSSISTCTSFSFVKFIELFNHKVCKISNRQKKPVLFICPKNLDNTYIIICMILSIILQSYTAKVWDDVCLGYFIVNIAVQGRIRIIGRSRGSETCYSPAISNSRKGWRCQVHWQKYYHHNSVVFGCLLGNVACSAGPSFLKHIYKYNRSSTRRSDIFKALPMTTKHNQRPCSLYLRL